MTSSFEVLRAARRAGREGNLLRALPLYARVVVDDPGQAEALHFFGLLSDDPMRSDNGLEWVERSLRLIGDNHDFLNNKELAMQKRNRFEDSIESVQLAPAFKRY